VARIVPTDLGWVATTPIVFPGAPPPQKLQAWVQLALWEARIRERRLKVEVLLQRNAHWLCRHVAEWTWQHGDDHPYQDGVLYDLEYDDQVEDIQHYVDLARSTSGPVLELGCGTGRLTIPLARAGFTVHGIDISHAMLDRLNARLASEDAAVRARVHVGHDDFRTVQSDKRYPLIIWPFNALHHCRRPEQVHAVLDRARTLLQPGGVLAIDCYLPDVGLYDRDPDHRDEPRTFTDPRTGQPLTSWERGWWDPQLQVHHVIYSYAPVDGPTAHTHLQLRMYTLGQLHRIVQTAGWHIHSQFQDFQSTPLGPNALKWVGCLTPRS
jgi:SAM-dependent methyltransferase